MTVATPDTMPRTLLYGALSRKSGDPDQESIESQIARERVTLVQEYGADGFEIVPDGKKDHFADDGYSGSKSDRGPALERAIRRAVELADDGSNRPVELWANTPARFARGSGRKDQARSVLELFVTMRREGVELRAVNDDDLVRREELVGFASRMAAKYSEELSESVTRSRLRDFSNGKAGWNLRDGYMVEREFAPNGRVIARHVVLDPERAELWRKIFELLRKGVPDPEIARNVNAAGWRTRKGHPFKPKTITEGVEHPFYGGYRAFHWGRADQQVVPGDHEALCPDWDDLMARRFASRRRGGTAASSGGPTGTSSGRRGRPTCNHAIGGMVYCKCGERMTTYTSTYVRRDGSRRRTYQCSAEGTGTCDTPPFDAEVLDGIIVAELDKLLVDFDAWREQQTAGHAQERERMAAEVERAERDYTEAVATREAAQREWLRLTRESDPRSDTALTGVELAQQEEERAGTLLTTTRDALASVPEHPETDRMLDFGIALREAIHGRMEKARGSMAAVNRALGELFKRFDVWEANGVEWTDAGPNFDTGPGGVWVKPFLHESVAASMLRTGREADITYVNEPDEEPRRWPQVPGVFSFDAPPPLRWLGTDLSETDRGSGSTSGPTCPAGASR